MININMTKRYATYLPEFFFHQYIAEVIYCLSRIFPCDQSNANAVNIDTVKKQNKTKITNKRLLYRLWWCPECFCKCDGTYIFSVMVHAYSHISTESSVASWDLQEAECLAVPAEVLVLSG